MPARLQLYIKKRDVRLFLLAGIALVGLGIFTFEQTQRLIDGAQSISHSNQVINQCDQLQKLLAEIAITSHTFNATGDSTYLVRYNSAMSRLPKNRRAIGDLLESKPDKRDHWTHVTTLIDSQVNRAALAIAGRENNNTNNIADTAQGEPQLLTASIQEQIDSINNRETSATPDAATSHRLQRLRYGLLSTTALLLTILGLLIYFFNRELRIRRQAERLLQLTSNDVSDLYNNAPCGYHSLDPNGLIINMNQTELKWLGYTDTELIGRMNISELLTETSKVTMKDTFATFKRRGFANNIELEFVRKDGSLLPALVNATMVVDSKGNFLKTRSVVIDNSERRKTETWLRALLEALPDSLIITNEAGIIVMANAESEVIFGYSKEELVGQYIETLLPGRFRDKHVENRSSFYLNPGERSMGTGMSLYALRKDGSEFPAEIRLSPLHSSEGLLVTASIRDISTRKQLDDKTRFLATIADNIQDPVIATNNELRIINWNKAAEKVFGWKQKEVLGSIATDVLKATHGVGSPAPSTEHDLKGLWQGEFTFQNKTGESLILWITTSGLKDSQGENIGSLALVRDITQQRRNEAQIAFMARMVENTNEGMYSVTNDFKVLTWNKVAEEIYGFKAEEVVGRSVYDIIRSTMTPDQRAKIRAEIINSEKWQAELKHYRKDGSLVYILASTSAIKNADGETTGFVSIARDITAQKASQDRIRRLALLVESTSEAVISISNSFQINTWNKGAENLFGYTHEETAGASLYSIIAPDSTEEEQTVLRNEIMKNGFVADNRYLKRRDNRPMFCSISITAIRNEDESTEGYVVVINDITKIKQAEQELIQALKKEKDLAELKSRFVSIASHEFRTPLATISLASGILKKYNGQLTANQMDQKFENIERQIHHMTQLLDDVLIIGKSEAGRLKPAFSEVNGDIFERLVSEAVSGQHCSHTIQFRENKRLPTFVTDVKLLRNIIINLVTNAIKFSPDSTDVQLNVDWRKSEVVFTVEDHGIGIPADDSKSLFTSFSRGSNVGAIEGTGLGLSIVKNAVELLNGTIDVESQVGVGTRFTVTLPFPVNMPENNHAHSLIN